MFKKIITSFLAAGTLSCCLYFLYLDKNEIIEDRLDNSYIEYTELSFVEPKESYGWEIIENGDETFVVVDDNTDEDFFLESEEQLDPDKTCYIYKYPKKTIHLV